MSDIPETHEIPLFPLGVVLMPGAPLPLHIFEERYKQMISECMESDTEFGMVFADGAGTRSVGCTARVVELVEKYDDGRLLILSEGVRRFRLVDVHTDRQPYYVAEVRYIVEEDPDPNVTPLAEECVALLERVVAAATEGSVDIEIESPYRNLSFAIAGRIDFSVEVRQEILELPSERERLEMVKGLLEDAARKLEKDKAVRDKSQTNGHVRKDWTPDEKPEEED